MQYADDARGSSHVEVSPAAFRTVGEPGFALYGVSHCSDFVDDQCNERPGKLNTDCGEPDNMINMRRYAPGRGVGRLGVAVALAMVITSCTSSSHTDATPQPTAACSRPAVSGVTATPVSITLADDHVVTAKLHIGQTLVVHNPDTDHLFARPTTNDPTVLCRLSGGTALLATFVAEHEGSAAVQSALDTRGCGGCAGRIRPANVTVLPPTTP